MLWTEVAEKLITHILCPNDFSEGCTVSVITK